jgi:hypothetical protein
MSGHSGDTAALLSLYIPTPWDEPPERAMGMCHAWMVEE